MHSSSSIVELVRVLTVDGLWLHGSLAAPPGQLSSTLNCDVLLLIHGTGGTFYTSSLFDQLTARFLAAGVSILRINTRGHDLVWTSVRNLQRRFEGAACENVDECRHDLAAWVRWLADRGFTRIGLVGHSLGAIKAVYALAHDPLPPVVWVAAVSPPRLSHSHFKSSRRAAEFLRDFESASALVESGHPDELMRVSFPLPYLVTAAGYLDKYGPPERYNVLTHAARLSLPALFTFGTVELAQIPFAGLPDALNDLGRETIQLAIIDRADHFYTGLTGTLADRIATYAAGPTSDI